MIILAELSGIRLPAQEDFPKKPIAGLIIKNLSTVYILKL